MDKRKAKHVQSVIALLVEGKTTTSQAMAKLSLSRMQISRLKRKYIAKGQNDLYIKKKEGDVANKTSKDIIDKIISLYREKYYGFNFSHYYEMLTEHEEINISRVTVYRYLRKAGFFSPKGNKKCKKKNLHPSRERRKCFGELIQIDGSIHLWFGEEKYTLHAAIDDATSHIVGAYFDKEETLVGYLQMLKQILLNYGIPESFYSDRRTIFEYQKLSEKEKALEKDTFTQFQRCLNQLGVSIISTSVSQAKGRVERLFNTLQDRLISEMRFFGITSVDQANKYLIKHIKKHNDKFALPIDYATSLFVPSPSEEELDFYLAIEYQRIIDNGSVFHFYGKKLQLINSHGEIIAIPSKTRIKIYKTLDNRYFAIYNDRFYETSASTFTKVTVKNEKEKRKYIPPSNHPWRRFVIIKK